MEPIQRAYKYESVEIFLRWDLNHPIDGTQSWPKKFDQIHHVRARAGTFWRISYLENFLTVFWQRLFHFFSRMYDSCFGMHGSVWYSRLIRVPSLHSNRRGSKKAHDWSLIPFAYLCLPHNSALSPKCTNLLVRRCEVPCSSSANTKNLNHV